ncbi:MAG: TraR/DksA C4-type zinc finger protein [Pseudomonadota bacterium]
MNMFNAERLAKRLKWSHDVHMKIKIGSYSGGRTAISGNTSDIIRLPRLARDTSHTRSAHRNAELLAAIEKAISRLDNGTYGICSCCGSEIGVDRLMANPLTTLCDICDD